MTHLFCLDTDILYQQPHNEEKVRTLRGEFEAIKASKLPLNSWNQILFIEDTLTFSPFSFWEYLCTRPRRHLSRYESYERAQAKVDEEIDAVKRRFTVKTVIDSTTFVTGVLLGAATGVSCDDAYHFVYAIEESADFFVTNTASDYAFLIDSYNKNDVVAEMKRLLRTHHIVGWLQRSKIKREIDLLQKLSWPRILTSYVDLPYS